ncbi:hypothetical protein CYMTET_54847, partial [Cymbomonas tetramitiformis]
MDLPMPPPMPLSTLDPNVIKVTEAVVANANAERNPAQQLQQLQIVSAELLQVYQVYFEAGEESDLKTRALRSFKATVLRDSSNSLHLLSFEELGLTAGMDQPSSNSPPSLFSNLSDSLDNISTPSSRQDSPTSSSGFGPKSSRHTHMHDAAVDHRSLVETSEGHSEPKLRKLQQTEAAGDISQ